MEVLPHLVNYTPAEPPAVLAVPMGEGDLPYESFLSTLQSHGFDGWVSYEMCSPIRGGGSLDNLKKYARGFIEYMNRFAGGSGFTPTGPAEAGHDGRF